ncbi:DUF2384 domain-containing protein [Pseudomonas sp. v388]|uniref:antitoxin Xre/MbcA/ParS toxin-binding domain-containing protein n=1 Tax=Pseudomonas sp. v388 TaxID=2479849 RepID=UPI000F798DDC|nr:antitoxin Xre/MbcA/ParS toxin-binding domain-containing protein [Pseudomonas sp. v388]RRV10437.1 DUF2384 domain-containing protein [Pseudomonas sp. v388]
MLIELELNSNDSEALLRHCAEYRANTGDFREDSRLADALEALACAIKDAVERQHLNDEAMVMIDPALLEAAVGLFQERALAINWLSKPMRALDGKRPLDVSVEEALTLIRRLEHGVFA